MSYVDEVLEIVQKKNADQPEFLQAVTEVLDSLRPCIEANEELYRKNAILERITEPDRQLMFRVPWEMTTDRYRSTEVSVYSSTMPLDHTREVSDFTHQ